VSPFKANPGLTEREECDVALQGKDLKMHFVARTLLGAAILLPAAMAGRADPLISRFVTQTTPHGVVWTSLADSPTFASYQGDLYRDGGAQLFGGSKAMLTLPPDSLLFEDDHLLTVTPDDGSTAPDEQNGVPEPPSLALFGIGLLVGCGLIYRKMGARKL
jgi:hypothetical protein